MSDQQLTQPDSARNEDKYSEVWEVYISSQKEPYLLNEYEYAILKDQLIRGIKSIIHFDRFAINTSFITSTYRKSRRLKPAYIPKQLEAKPQKEPTPEEAEKIKEMIVEMRKKLNVKIKKI